MVAANVVLFLLN